MKNTLISSAVLSLSLLSLPGFTADLAIPDSVPSMQVAVAAQDLLAPPVQRTSAARRATPVQLAGIGESQGGGSLGSLQDAPLSSAAVVAETSGGVPSTPIALASLLLMLCILIGRRNA